MFKLVIQDDEGKTTVVPLIRDEITIGRKEGNTIRLTERNVSRRHARILRNNGEVQIEDLGSYNGIRVNNARIAERVSLRISDQVQIGDYKLYLKAEGVEQVDDARTMPIERIEGNGAPPAGATEVMAAVQAPAAPIPAPPVPPAQRSAIAVADTDPAGRPVATAAQVAALTAPTGYGKLVVVSSNFAGKEFDLTRPQMIVGRTDENDLVINHRSISRNHAKVTRDPETQRYTISDLQSSNGVRVNGQDYGKVELRRGDVVDLGHVRLRFVEPGEDFVFERDAVIADVPEASNKRNLAIAIILAIVLLGAVGAFFALKGGGGESKPEHTGSDVVGSAGSNVVAVVGDQHGSNLVGSSGPLVDTPIDAAPAVATTGDNAVEIKRITSDCLQDVTARKWPDVANCGDRLAALDPKGAANFKKQAVAELAADREAAFMQEAIKNENLTEARKHLSAIPADSSYHKDAQVQFDAAETKVVDDFRARGVKLKHDHDCKSIDVLIGQAAKQSAKAADAVKASKCEPPPPPTDCATTLRDAHDRKCLQQFCGGHESDPHCAAATPTGGGCDPDPMREQGMQQYTMGQFSAALTQFEGSLKCRNDSRGNELSFMASCSSGSLAKAKVYYKRLSGDKQSKLALICIRNRITKDMLESP